MKILGIDPGLRRTGFGVIEISGQQMRYLGSGTIRPAVDGTEPERLIELFSGVREIMDHYQPDCAVIERVFVNVNPKSTLILGQARGVAIAAVAQSFIPIEEITPLKIKQSVVGSGRATKEQVQKMVQRHLALGRVPPADAADALACAIAFTQTMGHKQALAAAKDRESSQRKSNQFKRKSS
jgi:crossover junction endodeoxyribonuclease RuvC